MVGEPEILEADIVPLDVNGVLRLRDYQVQAVDSVFESFREYDALILVLATGLGKTIVSADVMLRWPEPAGRVLFIAHVQELITQAQDKIDIHTTYRPAIEMGINRGETNNTALLHKSRFVVASIQTLTRRKELFDPTEFGLIIIDECHHAVADSYRKVLKYFQEYNEDIKILGITATPYRGDNLSLASFAQHCCFEMGIREGIDEGYLVPILQKYIVVDGLDFSACRTVAKDLNEGDLEDVMMGGAVEEGMSDEERLQALQRQEQMLHRVAAPTVKESQGRPTLVFCVTVAHAQRMAEVLRRYPGITAEVVHGKTPWEERTRLVDQFKAGIIQMLVGVGVFTEGFDAPNAAVIAMARPTKKQGLYVQMIGRGTRPLTGLIDKYDTVEERQQAIANSLKQNCTILDFVGNSGKHKLISTADVLAGDMPPELVEAAIQEMQETGNVEDIREATWRKKEERDEEERLAELERQRKKKEMEAREEARRAKLRAEAEYRAREIDPFGSDHAPERATPKYRGGATDGQVRYLVQLGVAEETAMAWGKGQAGAVIDEMSKRTGGKWIMRFGKHMGKPLNKIPHSYLKWGATELKDQNFQNNLELYRQEYREQRKW